MLILSLLLDERSEIYALVKLISFCAWVTNPALVIEVFSHLIRD